MAKRVKKVKEKVKPRSLSKKMTAKTIRKTVKKRSGLKTPKVKKKVLSKKSKPTKSKKSPVAKKIKTTSHATLDKSLRKLLADIRVKRQPKPTSLLDFATRANFLPTDGQIKAFKALDRFLKDGKKRCFVLKGHAGTGKTAMIKILYYYTKDLLHLHCGLMAPTSRAARVIEKAVGGDARAGTIHGTIYSLASIHDEQDTASYTNLSPSFSYPVERIAPINKGAVYVVDEASMVSNRFNDGGFYRYGTGFLLRDLIDATSPNNPKFSSKLIFVGDEYQLPPPDGGDSDALDIELLRTDLGVTAEEITLTEVKRQGLHSGILSSAQGIRDVLDSGIYNGFDLDYSKGDVEVKIEPDMCKDLIDAFRKDESEGILIADKNVTVFQLNEAIRMMHWKVAGKPLQKGDRLLAYRNNPRSGLINGEFVMVEAIVPLTKDEERTIVVYHKDPETGRVSTSTLTFGKIIFRSPGENVPTLFGETFYIQEFLNRPGRELNDDEFRALYDDACKRFIAANPGVPLHINPKPWAFLNFLRLDPYLNAGLLKYGYAMTCQKAQGGQWDVVGVVFDSLAGTRKKRFYRWSYTAITRAIKKLNVCNVPFLTSLSLLKGKAGVRYVPVRKKTPIRPAPMAKPVANPVAQRMFLDSVISDKLKKMEVDLKPMIDDPPVATPFRYELWRDGVWCVLLFDLSKLGFFSNIRYEKRKAKKGIPATDAKFGSEMIEVITKLVDPTGEGVEYVELTPKEISEEDKE